LALQLIHFLYIHFQERRVKVQSLASNKVSVNILVITTGGTIGALPYEDPQRPPQFSSMPPKGRDLVRDALGTHFATHDTRCISLQPRDSKQIDKLYRKNILAIVEAAAENAILITHGTDTILQSADFLYRRFSNSLGRKAIILTGAMIPLANGQASDGHLNLAFSLDLLTRFAPELAKINIVLCDFDKGGAWKPRLYPYRPNQYTKFYDSDGRYNRIRELEIVRKQSG
jgi:L-asparaginase